MHIICREDKRKVDLIDPLECTTDNDRPHLLRRHVLHREHTRCSCLPVLQLPLPFYNLYPNELEVPLEDFKDFQSSFSFSYCYY
jgi:hypothetical protein